MGISPSSQNMILEVAIGRAGSDWANSGPGQNWPGFFGPKF